MTAQRPVRLLAIVLSLAAMLPAQVDPHPPSGRLDGPPIDGEALKAAVDRILARVVVDLRRELHAAIDDATQRQGAASLEDVLALLEGRSVGEGRSAADRLAPSPAADPLLAGLVAAGLEIAPASSTFQRLHRVEDRRAYRVVSVPAGIERLPEGHLARRLQVGDVVLAPAGAGGMPEVVSAKTGRRTALPGLAASPGEEGARVPSARDLVNEAIQSALSGQNPPALPVPGRAAGPLPDDPKRLVEQAWREAMRTVLDGAPGGVMVIPPPPSRNPPAAGDPGKH